MAAFVSQIFWLHVCTMAGSADVLSNFIYMKEQTGAVQLSGGSYAIVISVLIQQLVTSCNDGATRMERTEQMYTIQKQMDFGKIKVRPNQNRFKYCL